MFDYTGKPWKAEDFVRTTAADTQYWLAPYTASVAHVVQVGPYSDPGGAFEVLTGQLLVKWPVQQPPAGTPQALESPRTEILAIFDVDTEFVKPYHQMFRSLDPFAFFAVGDRVAVWFNYVAPPRVVGKWRDGEDMIPRDNTGSMFR